MKKIRVVLFALLCLTSLSCQARKDGVQTEKTQTEKSVVAKKYLDVIQKADSVTFMLIDPWSESTENWMDGYGEVLTQKTCTCKDLKSNCYSVFSDPKAFEEKNMVKNCAFMPDVAMVFHKKKNMVTVSYSFYCEVCRFSRGGNDYVEYDGELVTKRVIELMSKAFPKDRYVRYLVKKSKSNFR